MGRRAPSKRREARQPRRLRAGRKRQRRRRTTMSRRRRRKRSQKRMRPPCSKQSSTRARLPKASATAQRTRLSGTNSHDKCETSPCFRLSSRQPTGRTRPACSTYGWTLSRVGMLRRLQCAASRQRPTWQGRSCRPFRPRTSWQAVASRKGRRSSASARSRACTTRTRTTQTTSRTEVRFETLVMDVDM